MHSLTCTVRDFNATTDTCTVEVQGIGIVDVWIDGVAIAPTVDRSFIVAGAPGVVTLPDINRPCDATLIQVTPPGDPVSYDPDQIVTYTGSLLVTTDDTGAGCQDVTFPTPYSSVPVVSASAAHPASVTISNVTESGFTACVTGGRVSSKHAVSYSSKSTKTSTATKNKALTVDHNEAEVGTHYILDFKDGDVVFTVTDRDSPARNQVEATLSDAFKTTLGGKGGPLVAFATSNLTGGIGAGVTTDPGDRLTWSNSTDVAVDRGGWVTAGTDGSTGQIVVPADGWYLLACETHFSTATLPQGWRYNIVLGVAWQDTVASVADNRDAYIYFDQSKPDSSPGEVYGCLPPVLVFLHAGSTVQFFCQDDTGAGLSYDVGFLTIVQLGSGSLTGSSTTVSFADAFPPAAGASLANALAWDTVLSDNTGGQVWTSDHPTRLIAPDDGIYLITANVEIGSSNATADGGFLALELYKNGDPDVPLYEANLILPAFPAPDRDSISFAVPLTLSAGDYLELSFGTNFDPGVVSVIPDGTTFSLTSIAASSTGSGGSGVSSIDGVSGDIGLLAGDGIAVTASGANITITNTLAASGLPSGGTTGQILTKASSTDYDADWQDPSGGPPSGAAGGDLTGSYPNPTLTTSGVTADTYGDSTHIPVLVVDAKGRVTSASTVAASGGSSYTLPDATTTSTGGTLIDYPAPGSHPIALTQSSQGKIRAAELPIGSADLDNTLFEGDLLYHHTPSTVAIGFIGDSITIDTPSGGNPPPTNVATDLSVGGLTVAATNRGINGTTSSDWTPSSGTGDYTAAKAAFLAAGVSVVHIMLGANDAKIAVATTQAAYKANLAAICADLAAAGIITVLSYPSYIVPGSVGGLWDASSDTSLLSYQTAIDQLVNGTTIRQGDITAYSYFSTHTAELSDGVHPTATGSSDLALFWAAALKPIVTSPLARLPIGAAGTVLQSNGTDPYWGTIATAGELLVTNGTSNPPVALTNEAGDDFLFAG